MEIALWLQLAVWLAVLGFFLASGQASVFHPAAVYLAFHGLVFVLRPFLVFFLGFDSIWNYMVLKPSEADLVRTLAVTSLAMVVFTLVCCLSGRSKVNFDQAIVRRFSETERLALILTTFLWTPLVIYSISITSNGSAYGERAANGVFIITQTNGYALDAQQVAGPLLCAWLIVTRFHRYNAIPIVFYIAYRSWIGWNRYSIVLFFVMVVVAYCWQHRRKWVPSWFFVAALPILILFNLLGHNRELLHAVKNEPVVLDNTSAAMTQAEKTRAQLDTQDFANFDYLAALVSMIPAKTGTYTYGAQYLQLFTEPIPRALWKEKPAGSPVSTFNIGQFANFIGLTFSLPGDGWASGGWIGVILTMGTVGLILGTAHKLFWRNMNNPIVALLYVSGLAMVPQWYRDGGISIAKFIFWTWAAFVVWIMITWMLGRRLVPSTSVVLGRGSKIRLVRYSPCGSPVSEPTITHIEVQR